MTQELLEWEDLTFPCHPHLAPVDDYTFDELGRYLLTGLGTMCPACGLRYRVTYPLELAEQYGSDYRRVVFDWVRR